LASGNGASAIKPLPKPPYITIRLQSHADSVGLRHLHGPVLDDIPACAIPLTQS
jgi:hypothetical protein